jgi:hypothetical protein
VNSSYPGSHCEPSSSLSPRLADETGWKPLRQTRTPAPEALVIVVTAEMACTDSILVLRAMAKLGGYTCPTTVETSSAGAWRKATTAVHGLLKPPADAMTAPRPCAEASVEMVVGTNGAVCARVDMRA